MAKLSAVCIAAVALLVGSPALADTPRIRIAQQFGLAYLPLVVAREQGLVERYAREAGLEQVEVVWQQFSGGSAMNDALISGNLDVAAAGVPPMVTMWAKTRRGLAVKGVASLGSMPNFLTTSNPKVHGLADLTEADRIALPAVKVGYQPVVLQMAAEQLFGPGNETRLDSLTVSMPHPDAAIALLSHAGTIDAHFTSSPFQERELADPAIHRVLSSYDVLGGPCTFDVVYATSRYRDANPVLMAAFVKALDAADAFIRTDPAAAAALYLKSETAPLPASEIARIIASPANDFTVTPQRSLKYAEFLARSHAIDAAPASWKELFFPEIHDRDGS
jgi:NitT/TauT family transport system substrate-binding protein